MKLFLIFSIFIISHSSYAGDGDSSSGIFLPISMVVTSSTLEDLKTNPNVFDITSFEKMNHTKLAGDGDDSVGMHLLFAEGMSSVSLMKARVVEVIGNGSSEDVIFDLNKGDSSLRYLAPADLLNTSLPKTAEALEESAVLDGAWIEI